VTASVVTFAIRDWSLWVLLRDGPWGPPMRLILGNESVTDAVERSIDALLLWPEEAALVQLKAGWQEQQVYVWGSEEQGAAMQEIARSVQHAAQGTAQVATNNGDVSSGASATGSAASQVLSSAQSLASESAHLKGAVEKFLSTVRAA